MRITKLGKLYFMKGEVKRKYYETYGATINDCFKMLERKMKYDEILNVIDDALNKYNNSTYLLIKEYLKRTNNKIIFQTENTITNTLKVKQVDFDGFVITVKTKHVDLIIVISEVLDVVEANGLIEIKMRNGFIVLY